ncbi:hypothetical protein HK100_004800 [Physocladia obscura]|uniref:Glycosyl transferase family 1 domain-containing protein n=1 Tax=Physocladia obscura TaxID=109957 RepID=A0AAD5X9Q7_9FUNG|nr:hypothetical protein HK100_004800 [Physocladia obscura]
MWPSTVKVTPKEEIYKLYESYVTKPTSIGPDEPAEQVDRRIRLWERRATEWFAVKLEKAVNTPKALLLDSLFKKRLAQWAWERPLMAWFMLRSEINPITVKPFSQEWDALLKQAIDALQKKYQIEKLHRGAFNLEILLDSITFVDKWALLFATGKVGVFIPNSSTLNLGITFGTIFLMLSSGFLELTITSCSEQVNNFKYANMSSVKQPLELVAQYQRFTDNMYRNELRKLVVRAFAIFVVVTAIFAVAYGMQDQTHTAFLYYGIASLNYCGLLVGLFNKMFISINENHLNQLLAGSILLSTAISTMLIVLLKDNTYSLLATGLSCWGFAASCLFVRFRERARSPHYDISIGPNLRTSGQRMIGFVSNTYTEKQLRVYSKKLLNERDSFDLCHPSSGVGLSVLTYLESTINKISSLKLGNIAPQTPAHDLIFVLETAIRDFKSMTLVVREVPGVLTAGDVSYAAIGAKSEMESLEIFVSGTSYVSHDERAVLICEAIVHEVAESLGLPHSTACAMEIVMISYNYGKFHVPCRIDRQLEDSNLAQVDKIMANTLAESTKGATLGVDMDKHWLKFSHEERQWFFKTSTIWNSSMQNLTPLLITGKNIDQNFPLVRHCSRAPVGLDLKVGRLLGQLPDRISLWRFCAQNILTSYLACHISDAIAKGYSPPALSFPKTMVRPVPKKLSDSLNVHLAVSYFAMTCDPSFGREVSHLPAITRRPLCSLFWLNSIYFNILNQILLFSRDTFIKDFQLQSDHGVCQIFHYSLVNSKNDVKRIDDFEGGDKQTSIFFPSNYEMTQATDSGVHYMEIQRYVGSKPSRWEPSESDKPFSKAVVQIFPRFSRIVREKFLNEKEKIQKSHLYTFVPMTSKLPNSRFVFSGDLPVSLSNFDSSEQEQHWFYTDGPLTGLVKFAAFNQTHKLTKQKYRISVEFRYKIPFVNVIPKWGVFRREDFASWEVIVEYAPFSDPGAPMQPWSVRYRDGISNHSKIITFDYSHPKHVLTKTIITTANIQFESLDSVIGVEVSSVPEIIDDYFGIMSFLPFQRAPSSCETGATHLKARRRYGFFKSWPFIRVKSVEYSGSPYATRERRDMLWTAWRAGKIPGVFARYFDEASLQNELALKAYWSHRFSGNLIAAREALRSNRRLLSSVLYIADIPAKRTRLQIRYSDLAIFGNGGDSENISSFDAGGKDRSNGSDILEAICLDSGTWPTGGGGVGSCRRDVVDSLSRVRWTAIAEIAGAELEHKDYQIEKNINAIIYLPIFDNDMGSPMENIYKTLPYGVLGERSVRTTESIISKKFVPLVTELIDACMTEDLDVHRVRQDEQIILAFYEYFKLHDWRKSWDHPLTQRAWMTTFLEKAKELELAGILLKHESPTLAQISIIFTLFSRLLLILSKEIPNVPVVHVSHHGTQSLIAVVAKAIHGSSIIIWDHGMLWRERLFALGRDQMPSFTQIGFSGLTRLCTRLAYSRYLIDVRADYVTPCTNVQNVMWAAYLAGGKYLNDFERVALLSKCSAVLNGMNLKRFSIKRELAQQTPTAVMLSHISPVKDVMNAIKAAYHVVHEFKVSNYELHIYGSPNTDLGYTLACNAAIKELNLENNVFLKGLGNPTNVLPTGWLFVNSSITEGLPLAIGEAGLCGLPVVCTDVGGSREVISDLKTGAVYGAVVPPSRPRQLALGQIQVFCMTDGLDSFVNPARKILPPLAIGDLVAQGPDAIMQRISDPEINGLREKLGELFRQKTMSVFSIARYCREHEQILWLGELYKRHS